MHLLLQITIFEWMQAEIGRRPGGDNALDREGYALAAGLALGLVTLGELVRCILIATKCSHKYWLIS